MNDALNVMGLPLESCSFRPMTGFFRDGCCNTNAEDTGRHIVCVEVTRDFLAFSVAAGNDLVTPRLEYDFPGLKPGDRWCLCADRWVEALMQGMAPPIVLASTHEDVLASTHEDVLEQISLETLVPYGLDRPMSAEY